MELAAFSDRGIGTRERLEDYAADRIIETAGGLTLQITLVSDGAGGGEAGELAARLTSRTIFEYLEISKETSIPQLLIRAVEQANKAVYDELRGAGTSTVALAAVHLNDGSEYGRLYIAHVGNSRIYLMRDGRMVRLNIDHTLANEYTYAGQMSFEEAKQLDASDYVTRSIGIGAEVNVDIGFYAERGKDFVNSRRAFRIGQKGMKLEEGDTVFVASDGLFPYINEEEFLKHALDDNVERATRTLIKYAADRGPEDNIALSLLFVPSRNRKTVRTMERFSRQQRVGIGVFAMAILLLIGFLALQVLGGERQRVAFQATQTLVQQLILEASYTPTPTLPPPSITPTQPVVAGQVGSRFSPSQPVGLAVFAGRYIDPLQPDEINYISIAGADILSSGQTTNQANLYLQPGSSIRLNQVIDTPGSEQIDLLLKRGSDLFVNPGVFGNGGISIGLEQNPDIRMQSQNACMSVRQISADSTKPNDTDKVAVTCYGGMCSYNFTNGVPEAIPLGQQALLDVDNQQFISTSAVDAAQVREYSETIWQLSQREDQLSCLSSWLDEDNDTVNYPIDECPTEIGSAATRGCPDADDDGIQDSVDQCPAEPGPESNNGCPLPDLDDDGLEGNADLCPFDAGLAENDGCPTEGPQATQRVIVLTQMVVEQMAATAVMTPTPTIPPTATAIPLPQARDDDYSTSGGDSLSIPSPGVLGNDTLNGAALTPLNGTTTEGGTISLDRGGGFEYTSPTTFSGVDSFNYTLTGDNGSDTARVTINVLQPPLLPPVADFSVSPVIGSAPLTVSISDASTGPINSYSWDFGDGTLPSVSSDPGSHTYDAPGTFTITLTVSGPGGSDSATQNVVVNSQPPVACFTPTSSTIGVNGSVNFDASCSTGSIDSYSWDFGDGSTGSGTFISHTFTTASIFTVTLTVSGPGGVDQASGSVNAQLAAPQACFTPVNSNISINGSITFNASCSTGSITSYNWDFGNGIVNNAGQSPSRTYNAAGTFNVRLTVVGPGGQDDFFGSVNVSGLPVACFTPTDITVAPNAPVAFNAGCSSPLGTLTFSWNFGDGTTGSGQNPSHPYTTPGTYTVVLTVTGAGGVQNTFNGTVRVGNVPVAVNDPSPATRYQVTMNSALNVSAALGVLTNDTLNGASITTNSAPTPNTGTLNFNRSDGSFSYTPNTNTAGPVSFTYTLRNAVATVNGTANICVNPIATDDSYAISANTALVIAAPGPRANDLPATGTTVTFPGTVPDGTLSGTSAAGAFTFTPDTDFLGSSVFNYTLNAGVCTDTGSIRIDVLESNNPPVATDNNFDMVEGTTFVVPAPGIMADDSNGDAGEPGFGITASLVTGPASGTLVFNADGSFTYTPVVGFTGVVSFTYTVSDGSLTSAPATVTITVTANNAPVANNNSYVTLQNTTLTVPALTGVLINDFDLDADPLTAVLGTTVASGTLTLNANGSFTYIPPNGFTGLVTFTYRAFDGAVNSNLATVSIAVGNANTPPIANNDNYTMSAPATTLTINAANGVRANDTDLQSATNTLIIALVTDVTNGTLTLNANGSFTYTPDVGFNGVETFTYQATDPGGAVSNIATVTIAVDSNTAPVAVNDSYTVNQNDFIFVPANGVLGNDTDIDGNATIAGAIQVSSASNGSLFLYSDGSFDYFPNFGFFGTDSFTYRAVDNNSVFSNVAVVTITVNQVPTAVDDIYATAFDTPLNANVLTNDQPAGLTVFGAGAFPSFYGGSVTLAANGALNYIPPPFFFGQDFFYYQVTDGVLVSNYAIVIINVGFNTPPTANNDAYTTAADTPLVRNAAQGVLANDSDPEANNLEAFVTSNPTNGTLVLNANGSFTYTPNTGFNGGDSFSYQASDGLDFSNVAIVTITVGVGGGNSPPVASNDTYSTSSARTLTVNAPGVLRNDTDANGDPLTANLVTTVTRGTLVFNTDGSFVYTPPNARFKGTVTFTYQASDTAGALSGIATVTIAVSVPPPPPVPIEVPAPPPATRCTDTNFENPGMIRSNFLDDVDRANLYCRLIAAGGNYMYWLGSPITNGGNIGTRSVIDLGLIAAVDVFSMSGVTEFVNDVNICLQGSGYIIYMNASGQPRVPQLWSNWTTPSFPGYTCTTLYAPGTVILVSNKPE